MPMIQCCCSSQGGGGGDCTLDMYVLAMFMGVQRFNEESIDVQTSKTKHNRRSPNWIYVGGGWIWIIRATFHDRKDTI